MEQKFGINSLDLQMLREFCEHEGEVVSYQKGERMECEGESANWFGFVTEGCFKYTTNGINDGKEHITWFSFEGEYVGDYPNCLDGSPAQTTIEAMLPSRVFKVSGEQLSDMFHQNTKTMELRSIIAEHLLCQSRARYLDFYRATPFERYDLPKRNRFWRWEIGKTLKIVLDFLLKISFFCLNSDDLLIFA